MDKKVYLGSCVKNNCPGPVHVIEPGDTLYGIAQRYHTRVRILLDLNPFVDIYNLQPGDEICIPFEMVKEEKEFVPYVAKKGDTVGTFLDKASLSFEELAGINKSLRDIMIPEGMILLIPTGKK